MRVWPKCEGVWVCIHGQKAISRKSAANLSEGGAARTRNLFIHMCCPPRSPAFIRSEEFECHPPSDLMEDIGAPQRVEHSFGSSPHWHQREREQEMEDETAMIEDFTMENFRLPPPPQPQQPPRSPPPQMKFETRVDSDSWRELEGQQEEEIVFNAIPLCGRDKQFPQLSPFSFSARSQFRPLVSERYRERESRESRTSAFFPPSPPLPLSSVIFLSCRFSLPTDFSKENTSRSPSASCRLGG